MDESGACFSNRSRSERPSSVRASALPAPLFYGIAATGSYYFRFNSLRDAPPEGEALPPLRGRWTAAAVEGISLFSYSSQVRSLMIYRGRCLVSM